MAYSSCRRRLAGSAVLQHVVHGDGNYPRLSVKNTSVMDGSSKTPVKYCESVKEDLKPGEAAASVPGSGDCWGSCLKRVRLFVPPDYRHELLQLVKLAGPVIISQMMVFMISFVSTVVNVTVFPLALRGILILLLACFPCWAILINTEPLLLAVKQSPEVASLAQLYVKIFMPALPAAFMYQLQGRYLQNQVQMLIYKKVNGSTQVIQIDTDTRCFDLQGIIWPQVVTGVVANIFNAITQYVFLYPLDLGVAGSSAANAISQYVLSVVLYVYICWKGLHKATWGGWTMECLQEWGPFVKLAIPSMLMLCLEWWMFEIGGFLAGLISEAELGAQSIVYELSVVAYMCRVGNALGAGNIEQAKLSCKIPIVCSFFIACFVSVFACSTRNVLGYIFTTDQEILQRVADVMVIFSFMHLADAVAGVAGGVLRGAGKQTIGALCNLVGYYFIGFPIGASLMFAANMGIEDSDQNQYEVCTATFHCESSEEGGTRQDPSVPGQNKSTTTTVGNILSVQQLVLRRGLTLLLMIVILVVGIFASELFTRLLK
ncbi:hypothetical protein F7725_005270 [Dissostichus mawsoni]|uniref:Multidrug and toxin extrusion protein n=1 Tax=Dissostichus mawsoni TaxID=36200 RepID=A0A7J5YR44_DISMA|nr:hypothetical protein F7725_005270 [Dissostichus mawsoni]